MYSLQKIIECYMDANGCSYEDAAEFVSFNIECAYLGPNTPIILQDSF